MLAKIIPIYKSKNKDSFSNYRPISLLPSISKILEKVIHKQTYNFLHTCGVLNTSQYGFRESHSTINAVTKFITDTLISLENKQSSLSAFLDLSKAFDTIDHNILIQKLDFYGIRGHSLQWFQSYLSNRQQFVKYGNETSDRQIMKCGVPQGSVLGPLLFLVYVNDLPNCIRNCNTLQFADDTTVYVSGSNIAQLFTKLNSDLNILSDWFNSNKLSLNVNKSNYMLFSKSRNKLNHPSPSLEIAGTRIERTHHFKLLGLIIDENLTWNEHIQSCVSKLTSAFYAINRLKHIVPIDSLKSLYYALAYPHLLYGIIIWGSTFKKYTDKLFVLQKKIVRSILKCDYNAHSHPLFSRLGILKFHHIYQIEVSKFMYNYVNKLLPNQLSVMFNPSQSHCRTTRQSSHIRPHFVRLVISYNSILRNGPLIWNNIACESRTLPSVTRFTSVLKRDAIQRYKDHT